MTIGSPGTYAERLPKLKSSAMKDARRLEPALREAPGLILLIIVCRKSMQGMHPRQGFAWLGVGFRSDKG